MQALILVVKDPPFGRRVGALGHVQPPSTGKSTMIVMLVVQFGMTFIQPPTARDGFDFSRDLGKWHVAKPPGNSRMKLQ